MSSHYRLFVALPLPADLKRICQERISQLHSNLPMHKWVHRDDLHITLQFLGDVPVEQLVTLHEALPAAAAAVRPFTLTLGGLGWFGPPASPSVLWSSIQGETETLSELHKSVEAVTAPLGFTPEERPYKPHLTLARRYAGNTAFTVQQLDDAVSGWPQLEWTVQELVLYRSRLNMQPMYERLRSYPLG
jgi:2'-5' RNA ligase